MSAETFAWAALFAGFVYGPQIWFHLRVSRAERARERARWRALLSTKERDMREKGTWTPALEALPARDPKECG